jgi:hypothetical protein
VGRESGRSEGPAIGLLTGPVSGLAYGLVSSIPLGLVSTLVSAAGNRGSGLSFAKDGCPIERLLTEVLKLAR